MGSFPGLLLSIAGTFALCVLQAQTLGALSDSFRELSRRVHPSVVKVVATGFHSLSDDDETAEPGLLTRQQSSGSGTVLDGAGYIVTNAHVVTGAKKIRVILTSVRDDGMRAAVKPAGKVLRAQLVGFDTESDLALLRVPAEGLKALPLADSDEVEQGQMILAFGSPLGLDNSVSFGIVSSTARQLKPDDPMIYIQTDAPINPGSSGGPLVDAEGRVVGISTLILSQSGGNEGLGFAVPSNIVAHVVSQLRKHGRVVRGEVGLRVQTISPVLAQALALSQDWGVVVSDVDAGSPAEKAGIEPGDIVRSMNGKVMENARQFNVNVYLPAIGSSIQLELLRGRKSISTSLKVVERETEPERIAALAGRDENLVPELGVFVIDLTEKLRQQFGATRLQGGVLIASRLEDGPFFDEVLKSGDVLYSVNREPVHNTGQLRGILKRMQPGDAVALQVERQGRLLYVAFELQ